MKLNKQKNAFTFFALVCAVGGISAGATLLVACFVERAVSRHPQDEVCERGEYRLGHNRTVHIRNGGT